jgi:ABC-2 type transport system permease protein
VRLLGLLAVQLRMSLARGMAYRSNFVLDGLLAIAWAGVGLVPLYVAWHGRGAIGGWTFESALVVLGFFTLLKGILDGAVNPSLVAVVEHIRQGTLDFVLLKPRDAQLLVSTSRFEPWRIADVLLAFGVFFWAFSALGRVPRAVDVLAAGAMMIAAVLVLYSVWILVIAAAFWVVRLDNLAYLFNSVFDFARWPASVFKGVWRVLFTFVIPLALMTTVPAQALLGALEASTALAAVGGSIAFALVARAVWNRALGHYTSASS